LGGGGADEVFERPSLSGSGLQTCAPGAQHAGGPYLTCLHSQLRRKYLVTAEVRVPDEGHGGSDALDSTSQSVRMREF
jgi:hypothetical protein